MVDRKLIERIAGALSGDEVMVEKDWYQGSDISLVARISLITSGELDYYLDGFLKKLF